MNLFQIICCFLKSCLKTDIQKDLEIIALRSQLAIFQQQLTNHKISKPRCNNTFRRLWILLSKKFTAWKDALIIVKPETVLRWHRKAFKFYWRRKSKGGRPKISRATIALIKRIHRENPLLSPEKIHERLIELAVADAPASNTIAKYLREPRKSPTERQTQSWQAFLRNHAPKIWSMDFAVVPTLTFKIQYVFFIISHERRKIEYFAVTEHPNVLWLIQQIRNATSFGRQPKYIIHDNSGEFKSQLFQRFLSNIGVISKNTTPPSPWQNGICERLIGIIRRELLDHIIPLNKRHLERLLAEYVDYYNNVRTHQTLGGRPPIISDKPPTTSVRDTKLKAKPILGGLYHDYDKAA